MTLRLICMWAATAALAAMLYFKGNGNWEGVHMGLAYSVIVLSSLSTACALQLRKAGTNV